MNNLTDREHSFKIELAKQISFPQSVRDEFFEYWSEPNKSGTKMRYELQKTWDLKRRLQRWQRSNNNPVLQPVGEMKPQDKEMNYLNERLADYSRSPTSFTDESLTALYDYLKEKKVLRMEKSQIEIARAAGPERGKAIAVKMFFESLINKNLNFKHLMRDAK